MSKSGIACANKTDANRNKSLSSPIVIDKLTFFFLLIINPLLHNNAFEISCIRKYYGIMENGALAQKEQMLNFP